METVLVFKEESDTIIGACFEVYKERVCGFLEAVYQECLSIEFEHRAQVINYLKATGMQLGLLVNFSHYPQIEHERFVNQSLSRIS